MFAGRGGRLVGPSTWTDASHESGGMSHPHNIDQRAPIVRFEHDDIVVECEQHGSNSAGFVFGTSSVIWPIAMVLGRHLCRNRALVRGKRCVELGSGTGMCGLVAAAVGAARVLLTDTAEALPILRRNAADRADVAELSWGDEAHIAAVGGACFDVVLASDVIFHQEPPEMELLATTLAALLAPSGVCLIGYEFRDDWGAAATFCDSCVAAGLRVESEPIEAPDDLDDDFYLYTLTRAARA